MAYAKVRRAVTLALRLTALALGVFTLAAFLSWRAHTPPPAPRPPTMYLEASHAIQAAAEAERVAIQRCAAYAAAVDWGGLEADTRITAACMALVGDGQAADDIGPLQMRTPRRLEYGL